MKAIVGAAIALVLIAGPALAQSAQQPPAPPHPEADEQQSDAAGPPHASGEPDGWDRHDGDMRPRPMMMEGHRRPPPSKAARFRIEVGDLNIGMKCPDDEPMKACADFTLQMLDKIGSLPRR